MARTVNVGSGKTARLEGIPELEKAINELAGKINGKRLKRVLMRAAMACRDQARDLAPVRTGLLKENIVAAYGNGGTKDKADVIVTVRYGPGRANHAHLVEFGSSQAPAHPFMRPAVQATKAQMTKIIADGFKEIIAESEGK